MADFLYFGIVDHGGEVGSVTIPVDDFTIIGGVGDPVDDLTNMQAAIAGVTLGVVKNRYARLAQTVTAGLPASQWAQRELGARILMQGNTTGDSYTLTLPTLDLDAVTLVDNSDDIVLADAGPMAALVTALETYYEPDVAGTPESITVLRAYVVGRNN